MGRVWCREVELVLVRRQGPASCSRSGKGSVPCREMGAGSVPYRDSMN